MPQGKRLTKKQIAKNHIKCPRCTSRSYKQADTLNIIERIKFIGCKVWLCQKCGKKWA